MYQRGPLRQGGLESGHRRRRVDIDLDEFAGVLRDVPARRDHNRDRIADEADVGVGERWVVGASLWRPTGRGPQRTAEGIEVGGGEDGAHSWERLGGIDSDAPDLAGCHVASDERDVELTGQADVIRVPALAGEETRVLAALDPLADKAGSPRRGFGCGAHAWTFVAAPVTAGPPGGPAASRAARTMPW